MSIPSPFASAKNAVLFIAEVGGNHEGNPEALRLLHRLALSSGADVVKYQLYRGDTLVSPVEAADRNSHFKRFEIPFSTYEKLAHEAADAGIAFMASTWDIDFLPAVNALVTMHKVGSGDLTCRPVLRRLVDTKKPIILSTGLSTIGEVSDAVEYIHSLDSSYISERKLALLQCTSSYPCADDDVHLRAMDTLRSSFGLPTGFSDHTIGEMAIEAAVAMGAEIIEKHFTDKREGKTFRDHQISLTAAEVQSLLVRLSRIARLRGSPEKQPTPSEVAQGHVTAFRRSLYAATDIGAGEMYTVANLTVLRPAHGLPATRFDEVVGRTCITAKKRFEVIRDTDVG